MLDTFARCLAPSPGLLCCSWVSDVLFCETTVFSGVMGHRGGGAKRIPPNLETWIGWVLALLATGTGLVEIMRLDWDEICLVRSEHLASLV